MRYSETLVKTCTTRVLGLVHTAERQGLDSREKDRAEQDETETFGLISRSGLNRNSFGMFFHCMVALAKSTTV